MSLFSSRFTFQRYPFVSAAALLLTALAVVASAAELQEFTLTTAAIGPNGRAADVNEGEVAWSGDYAFPPAETISLQLAGVSLAPGAFLVFSNSAGTEWQSFSADDLTDGTITTRRFSGGVVAIDLLAGLGKSTFTVTQSTVGFAKGGDTLARRDIVETIYRQMRAEPIAAAEEAPSRPGQGKVIYGADNRVEPFQVTDARYLPLMKATAAVINRGDLTLNSGSYQIATNPWRSGGGGTLCNDEPFREQPIAPFCSGFLVGPDLLLTAGHCITSATACGTTGFVFEYAMKPDLTGVENPVPADRVYFCAEIINRAQSGNLDHALVRLDRVVTGREPVVIRREGTIATGTAVAVSGHPAGLPMKYADGAVVKNNLVGTPYFQANLDTYGGNSGSMVFNTNDFTVEGILVRGATDYRTRSGTTCIESNRLTDQTGSSTGSQWEEISKLDVVLPFIPLLVEPLGTVVFGRDRYRPEATAVITLRDSNLSGTGSTNVRLTTAQGLDVGITLTEVNSPSGRFEATISLAAFLLDLNTVLTVTYNDADGGGGVPAIVTDTTVIDGAPPSLTHVVTPLIRDTTARIELTVNEPSRGSLVVSRSCAGTDASTTTYTLASLLTSHTVPVAGLVPNTTYHFRTILEDEAGNVAVQSTGECFVLTTRSTVALPYQLFTSGTFDVANRTLVYTPLERNGDYGAAILPASTLPVPATGTAITLGDDDAKPFSFAVPFPFAGREWNTLHVGSNGYITFGLGSTAYLPQIAALHNLPTIAAHWTDLNPLAGGSVLARETEDGVVVTWDAIPYYSTTTTTNVVTLQIELFADGRIRQTTIGGTPTSSVLLGIASGDGTPNPSVPTDFSALPAATTFEPVSRYPFSGGSEGWTFISLGGFPAPDQKIADGAISFSSTNKSSAVAFWESPLIPISTDGSKVYRATWSVKSDVWDRRSAPSLRLRLSTPIFEESLLLVSTSEQSAPFSPSTDGYRYTSLMRPPAGTSALRMDVDLQHFSLTDASTFELSTTEVTLDAFPASALGAGSSVASFDLSSAGAWEGVTLPDLYTPAVLARTTQGLSLRGINPGAPPPALPSAVGLWTSPPLPGVTLQQGGILRYDFTVRGTLPLNETNRYGSLRLRINDTTNGTSLLLNLESDAVGGFPAVGETRTWSLYYLAPPGLGGVGTYASLDYIWAQGSGNDPAAELIVERLSVFSHSRPW